MRSPGRLFLDDLRSRLVCNGMRSARFRFTRADPVEDVVVERAKKRYSHQASLTRPPLRQLMPTVPKKSARAFVSRAPLAERWEAEILLLFPGGSHGSNLGRRRGSSFLRVFAAKRRRVSPSDRNNPLSRAPGHRRQSRTRSPHRRSQRKTSRRPTVKRTGERWLGPDGQAAHQ